MDNNKIFVNKNKEEKNRILEIYLEFRNKKIRASEINSKDLQVIEYLLEKEQTLNMQLDEGERRKFLEKNFDEYNKENTFNLLDEKKDQIKNDIKKHTENSIFFKSIDKVLKKK